MTAQRKPRRADRYTLLRIGDPQPLTPNIVRRMLDEIPDLSDIIEMSVSKERGLIDSRLVAIYYTTTMPWEDN